MGAKFSYSQTRLTVYRNDGDNDGISIRYFGIENFSKKKITIIGIDGKYIMKTTNSHGTKVRELNYETLVEEVARNEKLLFAFHFVNKNCPKSPTLMS